MRHATLFLPILFLAGCGSTPVPSPTPGPTPLDAAVITREQAIATAFKIASTSVPEISGALVAPSNVQAKLITLGQAMQQMFGNADAPRGYAADMPVWYVTMDGLWANQAQAPGITAAQMPYHHYIVVLVASNGMQIEGSLRP